MWSIFVFLQSISHKFLGLQMDIRSRLRLSRTCKISSGHSDHMFVGWEKKAPNVINKLKIMLLFHVRLPFCEQTRQMPCHHTCRHTVAVYSLYSSINTSIESFHKWTHNTTQNYNMTYCHQVYLIKRVFIPLSWDAYNKSNIIETGSAGPPAAL